MGHKRPCGVCRAWFEVNARAGKRQRVCGRAECQRERHRRACARWHTRNRGYDRERRLRERLLRDSGPGEPLNRDPTAQVIWSVARDAVGVEVAVIVEETAKVLWGWMRDAVRAQRHDIAWQSVKVLAGPARDAIVAGAGPP